MSPSVLSSYCEKKKPKNQTQKDQNQKHSRENSDFFYNIFIQIYTTVVVVLDVEAKPCDKNINQFCASQ